MRTGFSFSPGGLLLPYHLGVLECLQYNSGSSGIMDDSTPIAGSSAGAIAVAAHGCGLDHKSILEATIEISDRCQEKGGARGRLLPLLREQLYDRIGDQQLEILANREGKVGVAYKQIFPRKKAFLETEFQHRDDLVNAVCHSSMFPFFATNWPCAFDRSKGYPRLVVDGFFTVDRDRFGCPDFDVMAGVDVERTVTVSCFPKGAIGLNASLPEDCISPMMEEGGGDQLKRLFRLATESSSRKELTEVYESGWTDAERWCNLEAKKLSTKSAFTVRS